MNFAADFTGDAVADAARTFLSSYFVLDVTNPDKVPTLLWSFSDTNLGFTTSYPAVARVSPLTDPKTDNTNAKWFMVVGSGPTSYDAGVGQTGKMFAVNIKNRMTSTAAGVVTMFDASGGGATPPNSFIGDLVAFDRDLDYRTDVIYGGKAISAAPWEGKLIRLTTGCWNTSSPVCNTDPSLWGVPSGTPGVQAPSEILYQFLDGGGTTSTLGPVPAAVGVTIDQTGNTWVFAGTGRYYTQISGTGDKIDTSTQYLVGIKDSVMQGSGGCVGGDVTITGCRLSSTLSNELIDMSTATICAIGHWNLYRDGRESASHERAGHRWRRDLCVAHRARAKQKRLVCQIDGSGRRPPKRAGRGQPGCTGRDCVLPDLHAERRRLRRGREAAISMDCITSPAAPTRRPSWG